MADDPFVGRILAERYDVLALLGIGGMGAVYRARDRELDEIVALKVIRSELSHHPSALEQFRSEVKLARRVTHANVARTFELGSADGVMFCTMELVDGEPLTERLRRVHKLEVPEAVAIACALLDGLAAAHEANVIHRDIKPDNVLLARDGRVVVADFGVAAMLATGSEASGTPAYMSPEQARGEIEKIDERSDIYCATVLFHELMTLRHYLGEPSNLAELLKAIQEVPPTSPHNYAPHPIQGNTPAEYCHFLFHGLQKDPAARFQNVTEMIQLLQETLDGKVKVQCPVTLTKRFTRELGRFTDRNPRIAMSAFFGGSIGFVALLAWSIFAAIRLHG
jgi:serine/threonine-protein kinase